ncbi:hypothetical protein LP420_02935 [Massilia sp. B-10]|nr:hypothetical protein LP420_02935 [Massilia sp. B-10]
MLLLIVGIVFAVTGANLFGLILSNANFYLAPLRLIGLLPVYLVWALPTIGWLMMVSAWARSKVFLWAVGTLSHLCPDRQMGRLPAPYRHRRRLAVRERDCARSDGSVPRQLVLVHPRHPRQPHKATTTWSRWAMCSASRG